MYIKFVNTLIKKIRFILLFSCCLISTNRLYTIYSLYTHTYIY